MPPNTAASPRRSEVESRNAPQALAVPVILAISPSTMSDTTKKVTTSDALPQPPLREADQGAEHHPEGADDGHHVG